ncbi:rsbT co-antagonist protein RsbR [Sinobaca qinghaiensis]|uniref:RsbT co-antagonist protein RsbR n=1 Tax=Sinobaca qinghaiensis TaxID=342944 RepID=A0A419V4J1_9BACL|nr:STAS domain-containing protein [Sinobaca qinghaiensis]RKD73439.1 rsbT co-antagonist protein RsbR [Sinobaca qinghaiensis]
MKEKAATNYDQLLHDYLLSHSSRLSEEWYESIDDNDPSSIYASTDPETTKKLKEMNTTFIQQFVEIFNMEEGEFYQQFEQKFADTVKEEEYVNTPLVTLQKEFSRYRDMILGYIKSFVQSYHGEISQEELLAWNEKVTKAFDFTIQMFMREAIQKTEKQLQEQEEVINELSSPVIVLKKHQALLPLIGNIDAARSEIIAEKTLEECRQKEIEHLFIDLSGVLSIDRFVAQKVMDLSHALKLLGIETILSGMRPEIARKSINLGISFKEVRIVTNLNDALF